MGFRRVRQFLPGNPRGLADAVLGRCESGFHGVPQGTQTKVCSQRLNSLWIDCLLVNPLLHAIIYDSRDKSHLH